MTDEERKEKRRAADVAYYAVNKEKIKATKAVWRAANPEKVKAADVAYRAANPEKLKARRAVYLAANSEKIKTRAATYQRQRRAKDPVFSMSGRLRARLNIAFKTNGFKKNSCTEKMLGCTFKQFTQHIEKQFTDGMSWDNRGEWHLDHIVPLYCATTIEGLEKLSHYKNIRPLWAADNRAKSKNLLLS